MGKPTRLENQGGINQKLNCGLGGRSHRRIWEGRFPERRGWCSNVKDEKDLLRWPRAGQ